MANNTPLLLIILDGFGISLEKEGNPVAQAKTPVLQSFERNFPFTTLQASGVAVGLPWGESGNSEVGHLTMGSGRVIYHHLPRIIYSIYDGSFVQNESFLKAAEHVASNQSALHLAGLVSSGSVHSYIDHLYALLDFAKRQKIPRVYLHIFMDGKDAPPKEGDKFLELFQERIKKEWPNVSIASIIGRFYAMDRDEKWERTRKAYELMTEGLGAHSASTHAHIKSSYDAGITDEFIEPASMDVEGMSSAVRVKDNDALIFFNFREDSMRQLTHAFSDEVFDYFPRKKIFNLMLVTMTEYQKDLHEVHAAFPPLDINWPLSRVLGEAGLRHLHIAETEKYAHVTYFFNGGQERPFQGEDRILIPSISTAHFDEVPEMRSREITQKIIENFAQYDVVIANFANADMVGHSGNFNSAVEAVEVLDESLGQIMKAVLSVGGVMAVTGDHGNIELKRNVISGEKLTEHSLNPVPFYLIGEQFRLPREQSQKNIDTQKTKPGGILTDVAPTILELLGIPKPQEMTGASLLTILIRETEE